MIAPTPLSVEDLRILVAELAAAYVAQAKGTEQRSVDLDRDGAATVGDHGAAIVGDYGTAIVGYRGAATVGYGGTAIVGQDGTATAGDRGEIHLCWWDGQRYRTGVYYVGEDGVEADVAYRLDAARRLVRADEVAS